MSSGSLPLPSIAEFYSMFGSFHRFLSSPFHLLFSLVSRLQISVLVATVANKYRRPSTLIQTKTLRRTTQNEWLVSMVTTHMMKNYTMQSDALMYSLLSANKLR